MHGTDFIMLLENYFVIYNPFVPNAPFIYPLKSSENLMVMAPTSLVPIFGCSDRLTDKHYIHCKKGHEANVLTYRSSHQRCSIKRGVLRNFTKFTGKHLKFVKFLRPPFLQNTSGRLLLDLENLLINFSHNPSYYLLQKTKFCTKDIRSLRAIIVNAHMLRK